MGQISTSPASSDRDLASPARYQRATHRDPNVVVRLTVLWPLVARLVYGLCHMNAWAKNNKTLGTKIKEMRKAQPVSSDARDQLPSGQR